MVTSQPAAMPREEDGNMASQPSTMLTVRRLYIYTVSAVTLVIAAIGAANLLGLGLDKIFSAITGAGWIDAGPDWERERLSFSIPFIVIATPIWYLHWRMAQRAVRGAGAIAERRSLIRAAYFTGLVFVSLQIIIQGLNAVIELSTERLLGGFLDPWERDSVVSSLAGVMVAGALCAFHIIAYRRAIRDETAEHFSALLPQAGFYLASVIGALVLLFGASDLIRLVVDALTGDDGPGRWWREPLSSALALAATGGLVWTAHWFFTERLLATSSWWGKSRRSSGLRRGYLLSILVIATTMAIFHFAEGVDGIARFVLDVRERTHETRLSIIAGPMLATLPFIAFWLMHRRRLMAEAAGIGFSLSFLTARQLLSYFMAFVSLVMASAGAAMLFAEVVRMVGTEDTWRSDIGRPMGLVIGGGAVWAWYWSEIRARFAADPQTEQLSTSRRTYLFVVFGGGLVALVIGLAMTVYQVMQEALGVSESTQLASEIALPLGVTVLATGVALSHGLMLRRDLAVLEAVRHEEKEQAIEVGVRLTLTGPKGGDVDSVVEALRRHLPNGYRLTR